MYKDLYSFISVPCNSTIVGLAKRNLTSYMYPVFKNNLQNEGFYNFPESRFFFDESCQRIYQYPSSSYPEPVTPESLSDYVKPLKPNRLFDAATFYELLYKYLMLYAKHNIYGYSYVTYMDQIYKVLPRHTIFHDPQSNFILYDGCLCQKHKNTFIPVTASYFDNLQASQNLPLIPDSLKKKFVFALRHGYANSHESLSDTSFILDNTGTLAMHEYNPLNNKHNYITSQKSIPYLTTFLPTSFTLETYQIDSATIAFLRSLFGDNLKNFDVFSKLVAASYLNGNPLKNATIFVVDKNSANNLISFLNLIFENKIGYLSREQYQNISKNYASFFSSAYQKALIINDNMLPTYFKDIKSIVKSNYFTYFDHIMGNIRFKTTAPLIVITDNEEYATLFKTQVNSNVIIPAAPLPPIDNVSPASISHLRQALSLYGLRLFHHNTELKKKTLKSDVPNDYIVSKFIKDYCIADQNSCVLKSELRTKFKEYCNTFYPHSTQHDLTVCHELRKRGFFDGTKKRIPNHKNPVYIVQNIAFLSDRLDKDIQKHKEKHQQQQQEKPVKKTGFEKIMDLLYESKITPQSKLETLSK